MYVMEDRTTFFTVHVHALRNQEPIHDTLHTSINTSVILYWYLVYIQDKKVKELLSFSPTMRSKMRDFWNT